MIDTGCPICEGEGVRLGGLGRMIWYRCRDCGIEFPVDEVPRKEAKEA